MSAARRLRRQIARAAVDRGPADMPPWVVDQLEAASAEVMTRQLEMARRLVAIEPRAEVKALSGGRDVSVELLTALLRCRPCPHLGAAPQPALAALGADRVMCLRCASKPAPVDPANDDRCDLCEGHGHVDFREILLAAGPLQIHGNLGACCWAVLGLEEAA